MTNYRRIVAAHDFSSHSDAELAVAADLARQLSADLDVVHVIPEPTLVYPTMGLGGIVPPSVPVSVRNAAQSALEERIAGIMVPGRKASAYVVDGAAIDVALVEFSRELDADLLVMGTHGRTGLAHVFLGSVAERTLRNSPCPVLTVRAPENAAAKESHAIAEDVVDLATRRRENLEPDIAGENLRSPSGDTSRRYDDATK